MKYIIDIEANGLLRPEGRYKQATRLWCIVAKKLHEDEYEIFTDEQYEGAKPLRDFNEFVRTNVTAVVWHNGVRYDRPMLERFLGTDFSHCKMYDTFIMSRLNDYPRKSLGGKHSLKAWGQALGEYKGDYTDFDNYSHEMVDYCIQDTIVNEKVYDAVMAEAKFQSEKREKYPIALRLEHDMAGYIAQQCENGWLFDFKRCGELIEEITGKMSEMETEIEKNLEPIERLIDKEPKTAKYKKDGTYNAVTCRILSDYLGYTVVPEDALKSEPPVKAGEEFQRKEVIPAGLGNQDSVRAYLEKLGIKWTQWNWKKVGTEFIKMSPKMNEEDLKRLNHPHADMINDYYTLRSRRSVLQGWMTQADGDGRLRGDVMDLGAATGRHTHKVIANIPSPRAMYGSEIRSLFIAPKDKVLVSADGAAYQIRILAHYLKDEGYIDTILNGDAHQRHADIMGVSRAEAKPIFFSVIFGAGAGKVASYLGADQKTGKKVLDKLKNGIPGYANLEQKAKRIAQQNGWIPGPDGRKIYVDDDYKALNYLIQGTEAVLMKATIVAINKAFEDNGIEAKQLLMYHDECTWEVDPKDAEHAADLIRICFRNAPKEFGFDIFEAGDVNIGNNYLEVH